MTDEVSTMVVSRGCSEEEVSIGCYRYNDKDERRGDGRKIEMAECPAPCASYMTSVWGYGTLVSTCQKILGSVVQGDSSSLITVFKISQGSASILWGFAFSPLIYIIYRLALV